MIKFEVKGDIRKAVEAVTKNTQTVIEKELKVFALNTVRDAKSKVPVDEGALKNAIGFEIKKEGKGMEVLISAAKFYAPFVEFGTGKFAAGYVTSLPADWQTYAASFKGSGGGSMDDFIQRIMAWVERKGIGAQKTKSGNVSKSGSSYDAMQQAAYAIALNILQNGSKAHPFLYPAYRDNKKKLLVKLGAK